MNNSIITIFKKEMARFFGDKRTAFTTVLLPGLMIFVMYSIMGDAISNQFSVEENYKYECHMQNPPEDESLLKVIKDQFEIKEISSDGESDKVKQEITKKETDLFVIFPENFIQEIQAEHTMNADSPAADVPKVQIFYNSSETSSESAYNAMTSLLGEYEGSMMTNYFDINPQTEGISFDLATAEDRTGSIFSSMLPFLLLVFLYSGTIAIAPESIAGEKERGTIATLLVTPAKRSHIAVGKILALSFIALLSGASSAIGTILSMPKLMGAASDSLSGSVYSVTDYLLLAVVVLSTVLVFVSVISLVSAYAKSNKEAQTYCMPLMIVIMLIGLTSMFGGTAKDSLVYYCIPCYNSVQSMIQIFQFEAATLPVLITVGSNLAVTLLGTFILTKMFESERIIFSK